MVTSSRTLIAAAFVLASTAPALAGPFQSAPWIEQGDRCGTHQINRAALDPSYKPIELPAAAQRTIYLNRNGGTYHIGGATNSATNTASSQVSNGASGDITIAPLQAGFNWANIAACVRAHYRPYNVKITETEPTSGVYIEAVVGGDGTELGFPEGQLFGIASADNFCGVTEAGIAFSFSETHRQVPRADDELCATIAHEVGHLITLEHETMATDLMSYVLISESSTKTFNNSQSPCGVQPGQNQPCSCGGSSTNSGMRLSASLGLRPTETVPPTITLQSPGNGDKLAPSFEVRVRASDDMAMEGVTVMMNGVAFGSDFEPDGDQYVIAVSGVGEGAYTLTAEAMDQAGNTARAEIPVTVERRAIGESCTVGSDCTGNVCAQSSDGPFCTQTCEVANDTCPDGFACDENASVCASTDDGGCCSTNRNPTGASLLGLGVALLLVRRRRRAPAARN